ncbi:hypothetical protein N499_0469 [Wolbachia pipientis wVitA]|nr:hypothetical protein N499_0469 [Wolbachia pipientis wVitA]
MCENITFPFSKDLMNQIALNKNTTQRQKYEKPAIAFWIT